MCRPTTALHSTHKPRGFAAIGIFLFFGATMAALAAVTLIWRGTILDRAWALNPGAYAQLALFGRNIGILFLFLSLALAFAGIGWFGLRLWGWRLAIAVIGTQVIGDVISFIRGEWIRGGIGVVIAGALLLYLFSPRVRAAFV